MSGLSRSRSRPPRLISLILAVVCLAGAVPLASAQITIGVIAPLSGAVPSFGVTMMNAVDLAVRQWNERGGIRGNQIRTIVADGQCSAVPATLAARKLIEQDHVRYIIGEVCSGASIPVSEITNSARVLQITPTSTNPAVTASPSGMTKAWVFRSCFIDPYQGIVGARFAFNQLGARKAFVMADRTNSYVSGICDAFVPEFQRLGGSVVGQATYRSSDTSFSAQLMAVQRAGADVVLLPDYYNVVYLVTRQAKDMGISVPFIGGDGWDSSDLDLAAAAGSYFTNHFSAEDPRPEVQEFVAMYRDAYPDQGGPDAIAAVTYDAVQLLLQAIESVGSDDPERVRNALERIRFHGVTGDLAFDASHNPQKSAVIMSVQEEGIRFEAAVGP